MNTERYPTEHISPPPSPLPLSLAQRSGHADNGKARLHRPGRKRHDKARDRATKMQNQATGPTKTGRIDADRIVEKFIARILELVNYDMRYRKQKQSAHSVTGIADEAILALQAKLESEGYKVTHMFEDLKESQRKWIVVRFA